MKKISLVLTMVFLSLAGTAIADVPPPPANQALGLFDATIDFTTPDVDREFCQQCHVGSQVERHHALVTPTFGCFECHSITDGTFDEFRECTACHESSPHHTTAAALARHCSDCHGSFVADFDDGHYIPSYTPTSFTPLPGGVELDPVNNPDRFAGGCKSCHMADEAQGIAGNADTHHGTGLTGCTWCHDFTLEGNQMIRKCEDCHDVGSLHNIQADSNNDGVITPGTELSGYGHIGNNPDCYGCHVSTFFAFQSTTVAEPTIPSVTSLSASVLLAGQPATLKVTGDSFVNTSAGETFTPVVEITRGDDVVILYPEPSFTAKELMLPIPSTLETGNYELRVKKNEFLSNKMTLTVAAPIQINSAQIDKNHVVVTGSEFGSQPGEALLGITPGKILSWSDSQVVTSMPEASAGQSLTLVTATGAVANTEITADMDKIKSKDKTKDCINDTSSDCDKDRIKDQTKDKLIRNDRLNKKIK